jgi:hypothetical protein
MELAEIKEQLAFLRAEESRAEAKNFKERILPKVRSAVGSTYVYPANRSGCGDSRPTFRKIVAVGFSEHHAWIIYESCEITDPRHAKLETVADLIGSDTAEFPKPYDGWKPCPKEEYDMARAATLAQLERPAGIFVSFGEQMEVRFE